MFTRVTFQAIRLIERHELLLRFSGSFPIHIALLLQLTDLTTAANEMDETLISDEQEDNQKDQQGDHIFAPLAYLHRCPKLRKSHHTFKILRKVTKKLAYMQIFMYFCSRFNELGT